MDETKVESQNTLESTPKRRTESAPLVFISHDSRDADLAECFSKLLSSLSAGVLKSFRSSDKKGKQGIEYGQEWYPELMKNLEQSSDVVCILTRRSIERPWILYEAGVAKGKLSIPVLGVAFGIQLSEAITGPFAQFQNCQDDADELTKLVIQLLNRIPGSDPDQDAVKMQVEAFKSKANDILNKIDQQKEKKISKADEEASVAKLFEEIKIMFRDLPIRLEDYLRENVEMRGRRKLMRFHPKLLDELLHLTLERESNPAGILLLAGFIGDYIPGLYELLIELYRRVTSGDDQGIKDLLSQIQNYRKLYRMGPFMEEFGLGKEAFFLIEEMPMIMEHYLKRFVPKTKIILQKKSKEPSELSKDNKI